MESRSNKQSEAVSFSPAFVKIVATLVVATLVGVGGVFYRLTVSHAVLSERVKQLEQFGPKTGRRFTWDDGKDLQRRIDAMDVIIHNHRDRGAHSVADQRLNALERQINHINNKLKNGQ